MNSQSSKDFFFCPSVILADTSVSAVLGKRGSKVGVFLLLWLCERFHCNGEKNCANIVSPVCLKVVLCPTAVSAVQLLTSDWLFVPADGNTVALTWLTGQIPYQLTGS